MKNLCLLMIVTVVSLSIACEPVEINPPSPTIVVTNDSIRELVWMVSFAGTGPYHVELNPWHQTATFVLPEEPRAIFVESGTEWLLYVPVDLRANAIITIEDRTLPVVVVEQFGRSFEYIFHRK